MLERQGDVIADLIDLVLGNASPRMAGVTEKRVNMGSGAVSPPFPSLFSTIAYLIRFTHTNNMDLERREDTHVFIDKFDGDYEGHKVYPLGEEATQMLMYTDYLDKPLYENKYAENQEYALSIAHLAYNDLAFSKRFISKLLKCISYSDQDQIKRHLRVVTELARVKDKYQRHRLEYLFGFPFFMNCKDPLNPKIEQRFMPQYGAIVPHINKLEEIYLIGSPIDSQQVDDSLLPALLKYKNRMDGFTLTCLHTLCKLVSE